MTSNIMFVPLTNRRITSSGTQLMVQLNDWGTMIQRTNTNQGVVSQPSLFLVGIIAVANCKNIVVAVRVYPGRALRGSYNYLPTNVNPPIDS